MILKKVLLEPRIMIVALSVVGLITTLNWVYGQECNSPICEDLNEKLHFVYLAPASVTAKTSESFFPPQYAIDNNVDTKWVSTSTLKPWIKAELGHGMPISRVKVAWGDGSSHQYRFIVSVSRDGTNFIKVFSGRSAGTGTLERYSFPETWARYVRIMVTESTPGDTNSIAQISEMHVLMLRSPPTGQTPTSGPDSKYFSRVLFPK
jgi:hypothetical protein